MMLAIVFRELKAILTNKMTISSVLVSAILYFFFYPSAYLTQYSNNEPIALVSKCTGSGCTVERELSRKLNDSDGISIAVRCKSVNDGIKAYRDGLVSGVIVLPTNIEKDISLGLVSQIKIYADASHLIVYSNIVSSSIKVITAENLSLLNKANVGLKTVSESEWKSVPHLEVHDSVLYNKGFSYLKYILPVAFVLILLQSSLASAYLRTVSFARVSKDSIKTMICRSVAFMIIYAFVAACYFDLGAYYYHVGMYLNGAGFVRLMTAIFCMTFIGSILGRTLNSYRYGLIYVLLTSMPFFLLSGCVWPVGSMTELSSLVSQYTPIAFIGQILRSIVL